MGHAKVPDAAFLLPSLQQRHHDIDIDKAVAQHQVDLVAPQPLAGEPQAVFCLPVVGEILARSPDLVADEHLVVDAERRGELPDVHFSHSVEGRGVEDPAAGRPEPPGDFVQVVAPSAREEIEGDEGAEPDRGHHILAFGDLAHDQVASGNPALPDSWMSWIGLGNSY
jgi:hypothetical protein